MNNIILIGGGGHCKSVLDTILDLNQYDKIKILDLESNIDKKIFGVTIAGTDDDLIKFHNRGYDKAFITLGTTSSRIEKLELIKKIFFIPNIIDKTSVISKNLKLSYGIFVGKRAIINADCNIKKGCIINTGATIEHDCYVDEFVHIAPSAILLGGVRVGKNSFIGGGSVIKQGVTIGKNSVIGMGSVVIKNISDNVVAYGNPCREVKKVECIYNS